jgi:hypothetical protein
MVSSNGEVALGNDTVLLSGLVRTTSNTDQLPGIQVRVMMLMLLPTAASITGGLLG